MPCRCGGGQATCCRWQNCTGSRTAARRAALHGETGAGPRPWRRRGKVGEHGTGRGAVGAILSERRAAVEHPTRDSKGCSLRLAVDASIAACTLCPCGAVRACARSGRLHSLCYVPAAVRLHRAPLGRRKLCAVALDRERPGRPASRLVALEGCEVVPRPVRSAPYPALRHCRAARPPAAAPLAAFLRIARPPDLAGFCFTEKRRAVTLSALPLPGSM